METVLLESIIKLKLKKLLQKTQKVCKLSQETQDECIKDIQEECIKELSTFIFPKINSEEDVAILVEETTNYCERYFTYYAILYLIKKNQYDRTQEEMLVYECMKELYYVHENHKVIIDYMTLLYFESTKKSNKILCKC